MEKEEATRKYHPLWAFYGTWHNTCSFLFGFLPKTSNAKTFLISPIFKKTKGFTLVELLLVIGVLSVLSMGTLAILNPTAQFQKANDVRRKSDLYQIQRGLEGYYSDNGKYPPTYSPSDYRIKGLDGNVVGWGTSWQPYMDVLPKDPTSTKKYAYFSSSDGQSYFIYANLDRGTDPSACNRGAACNSLDSNGIPALSCGNTCNFGVSSPNVSP